MTYHTPRKRNFFFIPRLHKKPMKPLLLSKAVEGFILACNARQLSWHTVDDYSRTCKKFIAHIGDVPINSIVPQQINAFLAAQQVGRKTLLNYHIGLSALWTWAEKQEYVDRHIVRLVERPEPKILAIQPFTEVEIKALLASVKSDLYRNRALILLLLDTGARASEVSALKRTDIDLTRQQIKVLGKGDKERYLPFSQRTRQALFSHLGTTHEEPFPLTRVSLSQYLRRLGKRAGVPRVHAHRFRHTFAITFLRNGGDPYTLQAILGHSTMDMVKRYLNIAQVDIDTAHRRASPVEGWKL